MCQWSGLGYQSAITKVAFQVGVPRADMSLAWKNSGWALAQFPSLLFLRGVLVQLFCHFLLCSVPLPSGAGRKCSQQGRWDPSYGICSLVPTGSSSFSFLSLSMTSPNRIISLTSVFFNLVSTLGENLYCVWMSVPYFLPSRNRNPAQGLLHKTYMLIFT